MRVLPLECLVSSGKNRKQHTCKEFVKTYLLPVFAEDRSTAHASNSRPHNDYIYIFGNFRRREPIFNQIQLLTHCSNLLDIWRRNQRPQDIQNPKNHGKTAEEQERDDHLPEIKSKTENRFSFSSRKRFPGRRLATSKSLTMHAAWPSSKDRTKYRSQSKVEVDDFIITRPFELHCPAP